MQAIIVTKARHRLALRLVYVSRDIIVKKKVSLRLHVKMGHIKTKKDRANAKIALKAIIAVEI